MPIWPEISGVFGYGELIGGGFVSQNRTRSSSFILLFTIFFSYFYPACEITKMKRFE
jgi:hypothetical protein